MRTARRLAVKGVGGPGERRRLKNPNPLLSSAAILEPWARPMLAEASRRGQTTSPPRLRSAVGADDQPPSL